MQRTVILIVLLLAALRNGDVTADTPPAIKELAVLAERGDRQAQLLLGMRYRDGKGIAQDYREALHWYRKCADQGDAAGMDNVGFMHLRGWGVPVSFDIAAGYFKASAAQNHAQGQFNLGNCYFSGQGVEQNYQQAIASWRRAADQGHQESIWRLATLHATGEGLPRDRKIAKELCEKIAGDGHINGALLLGELLASQGKDAEARKWWAFAAERGSLGAEAMLELQSWRHREPVAGSLAYVEVDHLYQGWNNCGATSIAMFARKAGDEITPYAVKRLCPQNPIGTGTDWEDLVAVSKELKQSWKLVTFTYDQEGFTEGTEVLQRHLDAGHPVVIDFTVIRERDGKEERFGHTLLVVGYNAKRDQFVLKNPNQPPPGIQLMSAEELKSSWHSRGYSRLAKGRAARPLIVMDSQ